MQWKLEKSLQISKFNTINFSLEIEITSLRFSIHFDMIFYTGGVCKKVTRFLRVYKHHFPNTFLLCSTCILKFE